MLTTAQPNGLLYCTLHRFFFSPAPILPADGGAAMVRTTTTGGFREEEETPTYSDDVYNDVDVFPQVAAP